MVFHLVPGAGIACLYVPTLHILALLCFCWASVCFVIVIEWTDNLVLNFADVGKEDQVLWDTANKYYKVTPKKNGVWV
jgi:hypothetical protein